MGTESWCRYLTGTSDFRVPQAIYSRRNTLFYCKYMCFQGVHYLFCGFMAPPQRIVPKTIHWVDLNYNCLSKRQLCFTFHEFSFHIVCPYIACFGPFQQFVGQFVKIIVLILESFCSIILLHLIRYVLYSWHAI